MVKALLLQQFPRLSVRGVADVQNTGNFTVTCSTVAEINAADRAFQFGGLIPLGGTCVWPYGFVTTSDKQRELLVRVRGHLLGSVQL